MRVILDTNVLVSGIFFTGPPHQVLKAWYDGKLQLVISPEIFSEYLRVGATLAEQFPPVDLGKILELVKNKAIMVVAAALPEQICSDPDDDKFLACACVSKCNLIVSGDKHLLQVSGQSGIRVLKPRQFVDEYLP